MHASEEYITEVRQSENTLTSASTQRLTQSKGECSSFISPTKSGVKYLKSVWVHFCKVLKFLGFVFRK